jgi:hypothetical protein
MNKRHCISEFEETTAALTLPNETSVLLELPSEDKRQDAFQER